MTADGEVWTWSVAHLQMKQVGGLEPLGSVRDILQKSLPIMVKRVCGLRGQSGGVGRDGEETHFLPWSTMSELSFLCFSGPQFPSL